MPTAKRLTRRQLSGKIIDVHTHVGIGVWCYAAGSYPYCQSATELLAHMDANGVDAAVAFPFWESLFFDAHEFLARRRCRPARPALAPLGGELVVEPAPFVLENRLLCQEVYEKLPAARGRIMPFACLDPGRRVEVQLRELERLADEYPLYGLKVSGVAIQSSHRRLLGKAAGFLDFARRRNLPVLLHTTAYEGDRFCHSAINLAVVQAFPAVRFCLAHCLGFDKVCLDQADALPNAWVDSSAMKIQVQATEVIAPPERRFESDYGDYRAVFADLVKAYPRTMLWGSDAPAYTYIERRRYADGSWVNFRLQGSYAQEKAALNALSPPRRRQVANRNTLAFLFG